MVRGICSLSASLLLFQALECFRDGAAAVGREEFLDRLIRVEDEDAVSNPRVHYYNKVRTKLQSAARDLLPIARLLG